MPFGAFAEIVPGVDGLIHISQITNRRIGKPADALTEGETVEVKIIEIDNERQKVSLSIRALMENDEPTQAEVDNAAMPDEVVAVSEAKPEAETTEVPEPEEAAQADSEVEAEAGTETEQAEEPMEDKK